ncbi:helix-turn-helix transcriptional regulator [Alsobacter soli]|nr:LuxR family transcriptional regulator [Alsobacter soli]
MSVCYRDGSPPTSSDKSLDHRLASFINQRNLNHYAYWLRLVPGEIDCGIVLFTSNPQAWLNDFCSQKHTCDPLLSVCQQTIMPINWDDLASSDRKSKSALKVWELHGVGPRGLTVPIRGAVGDFALFSVASDEDAATWTNRLSQLTAEVVLFAFEIHASVMEAWVRNEGAARPLSPRERQVLTLAAQGLPHKAVAFALAISERAVKLYLDSARAKLGAHNTAHAVAYAVSRRLIAPPGALRPGSRSPSGRPPVALAR